MLGKTEVIWNWCWYYEKILENFFEIISVRSGKNPADILKTLKQQGKYFPQTKIKKILMETTWNFYNLTSNKFKKKIAEERWRNFVNIWGTPETLSTGAFLTTLLLGRSHSSTPFRFFFFDIGSAISQCDTMLKQCYSKWKWGEGDRKEHQVEQKKKNKNKTKL